MRISQYPVRRAGNSMAPAAHTEAAPVAAATAVTAAQKK
jgi:hypothetical protein